MSEDEDDDDIKRQLRTVPRIIIPGMDKFIGNNNSTGIHIPLSNSASCLSEEEPSTH